MFYSMNPRALTISLLLLVVSCSGPSGQASSDQSWQLTFDGPAASEVLDVRSGDWHVVPVDGAPSPGHVLAQRATNPSAEFNVVLLGSLEQPDVELSVDMFSVAGEIDQGGGPIWRATDGQNYYIARFNPLEDNYRIYTVVGGQRTELASSTIENTGGWHSLRITMTGDHIRCYYDGELSLEVHDGTFTEAGQVGLWTKADAQTQFDDLQVN